MIVSINRTSDNTFIPISNSERPVAGNKCYVQTKDIIIDPLTEYLSITSTNVSRYHVAHAIYSLTINLLKET